jgi:hypothetical protein
MNLKCVIFMLIHKVEYSYLVPQHDTAQTQPAVNCYSTFNAQIMDTCAFINVYCVLQINDKRHSSLQKNFVAYVTTISPTDYRTPHKQSINVNIL